MEGITVKAVELQEEKSIQEVENELLEVHEAKYVDSPEGEESGIDKIDLRQETAVEAVQEEVVEEQVAEGIKEEDLLN